MTREEYIEKEIQKGAEIRLRDFELQLLKNMKQTPPEFREALKHNITELA